MLSPESPGHLRKWTATNRKSALVLRLNVAAAWHMGSGHKPRGSSLEASRPVCGRVQPAPGPSMSENPKPPTASQLFLRAQAGDLAAFVTFVEQFSGSVRRIAQEIIGGTVDPDDVVQETLLNIFRGLHTFQSMPHDPEGKGWVSTITRHTAYRLCRKANDSPQPIGETIEDTVTAAPEQGLDEMEACEEVAELLKLLTPQQRQVIYLRYWKQLTFAEIGKQLDITEENARKIHQRALDQLRNEPGAEPGDKP